MRCSGAEGKDDYVFNLPNNPEASVTIFSIQMSLAAGVLPITSWRRQEGWQFAALVLSWLEGIRSWGFRTSMYTNISISYNFFKHIKWHLLNQWQWFLFLFPTWWISVLESALQETLGLVMRTLKAKSPRSHCRTPGWLSMKTLINHSVLPWSHWRTGIIWKLVCQTKVPSAPTWEDYLPWELLKLHPVGPQEVGLSSLPGGHIKTVLTL